MDLNASLEQILNSGNAFGKRFYEILFDRYPESKQYFNGVDMKRQELVLTMALKLIEQYYTEGYPSIEQYLQHMGTRHSDVGVPRDFYPKWRDAMLHTLEQFHGDEWSESLSDDWSEAIDRASEVMFHGYDQRKGF